MSRLGVHGVDTTATPDASPRGPRPEDRAPSATVTAGSVVIPAHDEARLIGRGLDGLFGSLCAPVEVVVACNGCTDDTAGVARGTGHPLTVIELPVASKAAALRAADAVATTFPRVYLDADVLVGGRAIDALIRHLDRPGALAARPPVVFDTSASSRVVQRYYRARARLPAVMGSLWGAGIYALSAEGRRRFEEFPPLVADDLYVDGLFRVDEIEVVATDPVVVIAPRTTSGLLASLRRVYRGNRAVAGEVARDGARDRPGTRDTVRDLVRVARRGRRDLVDALVYAALVVVARGVAWRHTRSPDHWERDHTTRR
jgi:hypothetical protein